LTFAAWKSSSGASSKQPRSDTREEDYTGSRLGVGGYSSNKDRIGDQTPRPVSGGGTSSGSMESSITFRDVSGFGNNGNSGAPLTTGNNNGQGVTREKSRQYDDCVSAGRWGTLISP
jgi:hypothetical protein